MQRVMLAALCGILCVGSSPTSREKEEPRKPMSFHASVNAYANAIVSVKDPKTEMLFYVESNGRRLVAFDKDGAVAWSIDVFEAAQFKPAAGKAVIRHLRLDADKLWVTCGKSDTVKVDLRTGKTAYIGAD